MTLALALRASDGLVLASDSRVTSPYGESRDTSEKFMQVSRDVGIMTFGFAAPGYASITKLLDETKVNQYSTFDQIMEAAPSIFNSEFEKWLDMTKEIPAEVKPQVKSNPGVGFVLGGYDAIKTKQFRIVSYEGQGFKSNEIKDSPIFAAAQWHIAQYLLDLAYYTEISVQQLCNLAVFILLETATIEETVGGPIQLAKITPSQGYQRLHEDDIGEVIQSIQPQICELRGEIFRLSRQLLE